MTPLAIVCVVQAVALAAVCLRLAWPHDAEGHYVEHVGGDGIQQDDEEQEAPGADETQGRGKRLGFRA